MLNGPKVKNIKIVKSSKVTILLESAARITLFSIFGSLTFHNTARGVMIMIISLIMSTIS